MTDELKTVLQNLVLKQKIGGLLGVTIIDNLGVPIFQQLHHSFEQADRKLELSSSRFLSLNSNSSGAENQIINQGQNLYNIAYGAKYQTVQIRKHPLTIIFLAYSSASTGLILKEAKELDTYFSQLQTNARTHLQIQN